MPDGVIFLVARIDDRRALVGKASEMDAILLRVERLDVFALCAVPDVNLIIVRGRHEVVAPIVKIDAGHFAVRIDERRPKELGDFKGTEIGAVELECLLHRTRRIRGRRRSRHCCHVGPLFASSPFG